MRKNTFYWNTDAQEAFVRLKEALQKPLSLSRPDPNLPFIAQVDEGYMQFYTKSIKTHKNIISCASVKFGKSQQRYLCNEQKV